MQNLTIEQFVKRYMVLLFSWKQAEKTGMCGMTKLANEEIRELLNSHPVLWSTAMLYASSEFAGDGSENYDIAIARIAREMPSYIEAVKWNLDYFEKERANTP
jgi:hypothetical protein